MFFWISKSNYYNIVFKTNVYNFLETSKSLETSFDITQKVKYINDLKISKIDRQSIVLTANIQAVDFLNV